MTQHTQNNARSGHTGEQELSGPGHRTRKATHQAGTAVKKSQVAKDTAQMCIIRAAKEQERAGTPWVGRPGTTQPTHRASSTGGSQRLHL